MFIVLEGIDGAGTTTQAAMLSDWFQDKSIPSRLTFEPSEGGIGKLIREYLAGRAEAPDEGLHYHSLALLFAADRLDHLARVVEPGLSAGECVISDRYLLSSLVYQSLHCDLDWVGAINSEARPADLTILIDLPVEEAMQRLAKRDQAKGPEIYEVKSLQEKIRRGYLKMAGERFSDGEIALIDGTGSARKVHDMIVRRVAPRLGEFIEKPWPDEP